MFLSPFKVRPQSTRFIHELDYFNLEFSIILIGPFLKLLECILDLHLLVPNKRGLQLFLESLKIDL
jgi:hypothetical protein